LQHYTPQVRTPSDFAGFHKLYSCNERTITRTLKGIENTWDYTTQEALRSDLVPMQSFNNNLSNLLKLLSKTNLYPYFKLCKTFYYVLKERLYL